MDSKAIFSVRINGIQKWHVQIYVHDSYQLNIEVWFLLQSRVRSRFIRTTSWRSGFFSATEKITVLENLHKVCDDTVCPEEVFYSKHFCLFLLNYIFMVIIFLIWTKVKYIHQGWRMEKDSKNREFSPFSELIGDLSEQWSLRSKEILQPTGWLKLPLYIVKLYNNLPLHPSQLRNTYFLENIGFQPVVLLMVALFCKTFCW